jgi:hypothetical protein
MGGGGVILKWNLNKFGMDKICGLGEGKWFAVAKAAINLCD